MYGAVVVFENCMNISGQKMGVLLLARLIVPITVTVGVMF
jgi:hypothetical protein